MRSPHDTKLPDSFWAKITPENDCLVWTGHKTSNGYGRLTINSRRTLAHRFAAEDYHGSIPTGSLVLHHCDNPPCVEKMHLYFGTAQDNMDDKTKRGHNVKGENHFRAKLTEQQVRSIREQYETGDTSIKRLGKKYGVNSGTISQIVRRIIWKHVK